MREMVKPVHFRFFAMHELGLHPQNSGNQRPVGVSLGNIILTEMHRMMRWLNGAVFYMRYPLISGQETSAQTTTTAAAMELVVLRRYTCCYRQGTFSIDFISNHKFENDKFAKILLIIER